MNPNRVVTHNGKKKTVSFDVSQNITHTISRSHDGSTEQMRKLWYDDCDFARMNRDIFLIVQRNFVRYGTVLVPVP